jgi:hypothetical protein
MEWLRFSIALAIPALSGFVFISWLRREGAGLFENVFLGFGAGVGLLSFETFLLGLAGIPYGFASIAAVQALFTLPFLAGLYIDRGVSIPGPLKLRPAFDAGLLKVVVSSAVIVWLACKASFVLYEGLNRPILHHVDVWLNWSSVAKVFFYNRYLVLDPSDENFFGSAYRLYQGHPLLNPLTQVWVSTALGDFHEVLAKGWMPFYFISTLGVFFTTIRKEAGGFVALLSTFFLSTAPLFTYHAIDGYSDLPLAFYALSGTVILLRYMDGGGRRELVLSGLLFSMGAFTKSEGLIYLAAAGLVLFSYNMIERKRDWPGLLYFALPALAYIMPWVAFKAYYGLGFGHGYGAGAVTWTREFHPEVFGIYLRELFLTSNHGLTFSIFTVLVVTGIRTVMRTNIKYLCLTVLIVMAAFLFLYATTRDFTAVIYRTGTNRNVLTFMPIAFLAATLLAVRALGLGRGEGGPAGAG